MTTDVLPCSRRRHEVSVSGELVRRIYGGGKDDRAAHPSHNLVDLALREGDHPDGVQTQTAQRGLGQAEPAQSGICAAARLETRSQPELLGHLEYDQSIRSRDAKELADVVGGDSAAR